MPPIEVSSKTATPDQKAQTRIKIYQAVEAELAQPGSSQEQDPVIADAAAIIIRTMRAAMQNSPELRLIQIAVDKIPEMEQPLLDPTNTPENISLKDFINRIEKTTLAVATTMVKKPSPENIGKVLRVGATTVRRILIRLDLALEDLRTLSLDSLEASRIRKFLEEGKNLEEIIDITEAEIILLQLASSQDKQKAAEKLGISATTLWRKMKKLKIPA